MAEDFIYPVFTVNGQCVLKRLAMPADLAELQQIIGGPFEAWPWRGFLVLARTQGLAAGLDRNPFLFENVYGTAILSREFRGEFVGVTWRDLTTLEADYGVFLDSVTVLGR